jgi:hypothetical protein
VVKEILDARLLPMVVKPVPWVSPNVGVYSPLFSWMFINYYRRRVFICSIDSYESPGTPGSICFLVEW